MFFDTYDDTFDPLPNVSSREGQGTDGASVPGTEVRKAAVRFDIPVTPDPSSPVVHGATLAGRTVSRIVIVLHQADVYVSLAGPLGREEEEEVTDEVREYADVSHHGPVYKEIETAKKRQGADRCKETGLERERERERERQRERGVGQELVQRYARFLQC